MRITILVIASDDQPIYASHQECWRSYATTSPDITVYFLRQREDIEEAYRDGDTLWFPGKEATERVFEKTVAAFRYLPSSSYDFLVRTNLSSVWHFPNLLRFCETLPREAVFCGVLGNPGISGAGMILSPDVVRTLAENSDRVERCKWDDIDFGNVALLCDIPCLSGHRYDPRCRGVVDLVWRVGYHFYLKNMTGETRNVETEIDVMRYLIEKIYGCEPTRDDVCVDH